MLDSGLRVFLLMILQPRRVPEVWGELVYKGVCSGISIQCKEVLTGVAFNCYRMGKCWGLLYKQVSSALFQFKMKPSR